MGLKSLVIDLKTQKANIVTTESVTVSYHHSLTVFRGQSFFTSSFTIKNNQGHFVTCLDKHYERFIRSYHRMFERSIFPLSYEQFKDYVDQLLAANKDSEQQNLHCIMSCVAGKSQSQSFEDGRYSNGFGGELVELVMVINEFEPKPSWCYEKGLNVLTMPYQRPLATAKPSHYLGGVQGQHIIDALNTAALLFKTQHTCSIEQALDVSYKSYQALNEFDQYSYRRLCHDCWAMTQASDIQKIKSLYPKDIQDLPVFESLAYDEVKQLNKQYDAYFKQLWHEVIFVSEDENPYLYEGSTFSLLGIDKDDTCVFIPLHGNSSKADDLNTGYVLESTTIAMLQHVAKQNQISHRVSSLRYEDVSQLKALYCVSTTRLSLQDNVYQLQPCRRFDNESLTIAPSKTYDDLMQGVHAFMDSYSYNMSLETPYLMAKSDTVKASR
ncbi:MAG: hypothetical protein CMP21_04220 [Rickettsiales bacterium]|nr:hypothetical protein [Rickettsiales bacterium]